MKPITKDDVFDMPHPNVLLREPEGHCRWFVMEFFTSGQGEKVAGLRTIDGRHFATVAVEAKQFEVEGGDGDKKTLLAPSLEQATNIERGGRAEAQARFDEHHVLWQKRYDALDAAKRAEDEGDAPAALKHASAARAHDKAMKNHCHKHGLRLHHV